MDEKSWNYIAGIDDTDTVTSKEMTLSEFNEIANKIGLEGVKMRYGKDCYEIHFKGDIGPICLSRWGEEYEFEISDLNIEIKEDDNG